MWAVTVGGKVMVRHGVTDTCPEGVGWLSIPTQTGKEVSQVSNDYLKMCHYYLKMCHDYLKMCHDYPKLRHVT